MGSIAGVGRGVAWGLRCKSKSAAVTHIHMKLLAVSGSAESLHLHIKIYMYVSEKYLILKHYFFRRHFYLSSFKVKLVINESSLWFNMV